MSPRFAAVIPAAGLSSRMRGATPPLPGDGFKPLLRLGENTLLERTARTFREAGVREIIVVAGHRADETLAEAGRLGLTAVINRDFEQGMFSSVKTGLAAVPANVGAVFVLPVDIPLIRPSTVRRLAESFVGEPVLLPVFQGETGHPPLIAAPGISFILGWQGEQGLRGALDVLAGPDGPKRVAVADAGVLFDVDTPGAYREAQHRFARNGIPTPEETTALLGLHGVSGRGLAHARAVADAALVLGKALPPSSPPLDLALIESAALLHDIAKGSPRHETEGGRLLRLEGFHEAAGIVAAHRDIPPEDAPSIRERELVYFADKLVRCDVFIGVPRRFQEKLDRFSGDAEAVAAITRRRNNALDMQKRIEGLAGRSVEAILAEAGILPDMHLVRGDGQACA